MKKYVITFLTAIFSIISCQNEAEKSQIILVVNGECCAEISLFDSENNKISQKYFDCKETKVLIFDLTTFGEITIKAEIREKKFEETIFLKAGETKEFSVIF